eukprot:3728530-Pyramimonas_sp.AAC.1
MTELTECKRVEEQDDWFLGVQGEFRRGELPTDAPGSWVNGAPLCGSALCVRDAEAIAQRNGL